MPGNPWFICTLWLAQYGSRTPRQSTSWTRRVRSWTGSTRARSCPSGVLAEQVNPYTGAPLSVVAAHLVATRPWSTLVQEYLDRCEALELKYPGTKRRYRKELGYERPEPEIPLEQGAGPGSGPVRRPSAPPLSPSPPKIQDRRSAPSGARPAVQTRRLPRRHTLIRRP